jgi:hypothetical protein
MFVANCEPQYAHLKRELFTILTIEGMNAGMSCPSTSRVRNLL